MIKTPLLAISLLSASCAFAGDMEDGESPVYVAKEHPIIIPPAYRGKIEIHSDGNVQWQMFVTGGGRYCNVWAMYPEQYESWEKASEPQPYTPEYSAWCKANPPRYQK